MLVGLSLLFIVFSFVLYFECRHRRYPPGPRPLPFIGNLHQIPGKDQWRKFKEWHEIYGPIITVHLGERVMIILGSYECTHDLLQKRGALYSSRPSYYIDGVGSAFHSAALPYSIQWRNHRRMLNSVLSNQESQSYRALQDVESKQLLYELLSTTDFAGRFHRFAASVAFGLAYGKRMVHGDEEKLQDVDRIMREILESVCLPAVAFPILDCIPRFLAPWKKKTEQLQDEQANLFTDTLKMALQRQSFNWSKRVADTKPAKDIDWVELAYVVGVCYEAGSDTTSFVLDVFVMASLLHTDAVQKAQKELDMVVGTNIPTFEDIPNLPYTRAFVNEVLRWRPVVPGGLHHAVTQDDEYMGYHIPQGATIIPNHWSLESDPDVFENPNNFDPQRWINNPDFPSSAFGFGRRVCPGKHLAMNSLNLAISRMLWAFNFRKVDNGELDPFDMTQGISSRPAPFQAAFIPRTKGHRDIIEQEWRGCDKDSQVIMEKIDAS